MSEMQGKQRSAVVFGARNLGRAVIELLVSDGWAVAGVARSQSTLDGVSAAGALALKADVTDPASVYGVLEQAAAAHGGVELAVNAAAAYGGERTGPFGGARLPRPTSTALTRGPRRRPSRPSRSCRPADDSRSRRAGQRHWCRSPAARPGGRCRDAVCGRQERSACERSPTRPRSSCAPRHPRCVADRRRRHPAARRVHAPRCLAGSAGRPAQDRRCRPLPR
jgi:short chain dehydrogenase